MNIPSEWSFKRDDVADSFERHVREQLPWYDLMSGAVAHIARHYITQGGRVYDLGCSIGNIGNLLRSTIESRNVEFIPIDNSPQMAHRYAGPGTIVIDDVCNVEIKPFDVAICFLCLMFIPKKNRSALIDRLKRSVVDGGIIIVVDKTESVGGYIGTAINRLTLAGKASCNVPADEIIEKELSLIGIQRPMSASELRDGVEIFRFGEFAGFALLPPFNQ